MSEQDKQILSWLVKIVDSKSELTQVSVINGSVVVFSPEIQITLEVFEQLELSKNEKFKNYALQLAYDIANGATKNMSARELVDFVNTTGSSSEKLRCYILLRTEYGLSKAAVSKYLAVLGRHAGLYIRVLKTTKDKYSKSGVFDCYELAPEEATLEAIFKAYRYQISLRDVRSALAKSISLGQYLVLRDLFSHSVAIKICESGLDKSFFTFCSRNVSRQIDVVLSDLVRLKKIDKTHPDILQAYWVFVHNNNLITSSEFMVLVDNIETKMFNIFSLYTIPSAGKSDIAQLLQLPEEVRAILVKILS